MQVFWEALGPFAARQQRRIASATDADIHVAAELRRRERSASAWGAALPHIDGQGAVPVAGALPTENWAPSKGR